jgi:hypothetical protein
MAFMERAAKQRSGGNGCFLYYSAHNIHYGYLFREHDEIHLWVILLINS